MYLSTPGGMAKVQLIATSMAKDKQGNVRPGAPSLSQIGMWHASLRVVVGAPVVLAEAGHHACISWNLVGSALLAHRHSTVPILGTNPQAESIDTLADNAAEWLLTLKPQQARRKAGMTSKRFWLKDLLQHFWLPT